ncbi:MAG TPA: STAS domain-containing protein [Bryobacteraceae bacterium]|nr:STAS domain-containing protein [Bryobacteraceae bacterium]
MTNSIKTRVTESGTTVVEISGRLHLGNSLSYAETAIKRLIADGARKVVVDLAELDFIDSAGIGMLISCGGAMEQAGGTLRIAGAHDGVVKTFEIVHMDRIVALDVDLETALRSFSDN